MTTTPLDTASSASAPVLHVHPWAEELRRLQTRWVLLKGGRWSTKTREVAAWIAEEMMARRVNVLILRKRQNSIAESNFATVKRVIEEMGVADQFEFLRTEIRHHGTGARVAFAGIERNLDSLRSRDTEDIVWIEEAHSVTEDELTTLGPTFRTPGSTCIATWNPHYEGAAFDQRWADPDFEATRIITHWTMLPHHLRTDALYQEIQNTLPELRAHVWDGAFRPVGVMSPFAAHLVDEAFARDFIPLGDLPENEKVAGVDVAWTAAPHSDYTAVVVLDAAGNEVRAERFKIADRTERTKRVADLVSDCFFVRVDSTENAGRETANDLAAIYNVPAYYYDFRNQKLREGQPTQGKNRLVSISQDRFAEGKYALRSPELREELSRFVQISDPTAMTPTKFQAEIGHDDLVCALMLAGSCNTRLGR